MKQISKDFIIGLLVKEFGNEHLNSRLVKVGTEMCEAINKGQTLPIDGVVHSSGLIN